MASASQMFLGGFIMTGASWLMGERFTQTPSWQAMTAVLYLAFIGSMVAYTGYTFLVKNVRPALATSYAYVNPVVAVLLGWLFIGESVTPLMLVAMAVILVGVGIVISSKK
jgi:drug/metabolite transporter (DMT)-like permease